MAYGDREQEAAIQVHVKYLSFLNNIYYYKENLYNTCHITCIVLLEGRVGAYVINQYFDIPASISCTCI